MINKPTNKWSNEIKATQTRQKEPAIPWDPQAEAEWPSATMASMRSGWQFGPDNLISLRSQEKSRKKSLCANIFCLISINSNWILMLFFHRPPSIFKLKNMGIYTGQSRTWFSGWRSLQKFTGGTAQISWCHTQGPFSQPREDLKNANLVYSYYQRQADTEKEEW